MKQDQVAQDPPAIQSFTPLMWVGLALFCIAATLPFMMLPLVFVVPPIAGVLCCVMAVIAGLRQRLYAQLAIALLFDIALIFIAIFLRHLAMTVD